MKRTEVEELVRGIFQVALQRVVPPGQDVALENEPDWDSVKQVELLFLLEEAVGFNFLEDEMDDLTSLSGAVNRVLARTQPIHS